MKSCVWNVANQCKRAINTIGIMIWTWYNCTGCQMHPDFLPLLFILNIGWGSLASAPGIRGPPEKGIGNKIIRVIFSQKFNFLINLIPFLKNYLKIIKVYCWCRPKLQKWIHFMKDEIEKKYIHILLKLSLLFWKQCKIGYWLIWRETTWVEDWKAFNSSNK